MRKSNEALRLQESLLAAARRVAQTEGALNQFIDVAKRAGRANVAKAKRVLNRAGKGKPPVPGDEIN